MFSTGKVNLLPEEHATTPRHAPELGLVGVQRSLGQGRACVLRYLPIVVGVQSIHGRVKTVIRRFIPVGGAAISSVEEGGAVHSSGVAIAAGVGPVDGRLCVGVLLGTCLRGAVATFRLLVPLVRRVDHSAYDCVTNIGNRVTTIGGGVALIGDAVATIGGLVPRVSEGLAFVGHARPLVGSGKTLLHADQA